MEYPVGTPVTRDRVAIEDPDTEATLKYPFIPPGCTGVTISFTEYPIPPEAIVADTRPPEEVTIFIKAPSPRPDVVVNKPVAVEYPEPAEVPTEVTSICPAALPAGEV
jgi:hypothetical protein